MEETVSVSELLEKLVPVCDAFSLTCPYNSHKDKFDPSKPYGVYTISAEHSANALEKLALTMKDMAQKQFDCLDSKEKDRLPPFEKLYEEIKSECVRYRGKHLREIEKNDGNAFFCDEFACGRTKYKEPAGLWHLYHSVDFYETCVWIVDKMRENVLSRAIDCELEQKDYNELKSSYVKTEVTFVWHCTVGQLSKVHYFKLDKNSIEWLKGHKDVFDFSELDDLAFYREGEVVFSSCTHERFYTMRENI